MGAIGLSQEPCVLFSQELHEGEQVDRWFLQYAARPLQGPQAGEPPVAVEHLQWRRRNIFKGKPRAPAA